MKQLFNNKLVIIGLLMALLMIPLFNISALVSERQALKSQVTEDIANSTARGQTVAGPLLLVEVVRYQTQWRQVNGANEWFLEKQPQTLLFAPEQLQWQTKLQSEQRHRGIYQAQLYHGEHHVTGHFQLPKWLGLANDPAQDHEQADWTVFKSARLLLAVSDVRGLTGTLAAQLNGYDLQFSPGTQWSVMNHGVHAPLALNQITEGKLPFSLDLNLTGTSTLALLPVAAQSEWDVQADWPHPSFVGQYLPSNRTITDQQFTAHWQTSYFANNLGEQLQQCLTGNCAINNKTFAVSLVEPIDQYTQHFRASKYALLFVLLTFACCFLVEVLQKLRIHPLQYLMVGATLAVFYLLLLALAEVLGFAMAYTLATLGCVLLLWGYLSAVLHSQKLATAFAGALTALYAVLYLILQAEDQALLAGSLLTFALLAVLMLSTRKLDWYQMLGREQQFDAQN